jgi:hypothetical protein
MNCSPSGRIILPPGRIAPAGRCCAGLIPAGALKLCDASIPANERQKSQHRKA